MLKVLSKVTYTNGSLFQVKDDRTGEARLLSEPTLGKYAEANRVANASVVHRDGARIFVRLASGVPSKEVDKQIPQFKNDYDNAEAEQAKKWFNFVNAKPSSSVKSTTPEVSVGKEVKASSLWNDEEEVVAPAPVKKKETFVDKLRSLEYEDDYALTEVGIGIFKFEFFDADRDTIDVHFYKSKSDYNSDNPVASAEGISVEGLEMIEDLLDIEDDNDRGAFRELTNSAYENRKEVYVERDKFYETIKNLHGYDTVIYRGDIGDGIKFEIRVYLDLKEEENDGDGLIFELRLMGVEGLDEDVYRAGESKTYLDCVENILDLSCFDLSSFGYDVNDISDLRRWLDILSEENYAEDIVGRNIYISDDGGGTYWLCTDKKCTEFLKSGKYRVMLHGFRYGQWVVKPKVSAIIDEVTYDATELVSECKHLGVNSVVEYLDEHTHFRTFGECTVPFVPLTDEEVQVLKDNDHEDWLTFYDRIIAKVATGEVVEEKGGYMAVDLEKACDSPEDFHYDYEDGVIFTIGCDSYRERKGVLLKVDDYDMLDWEIVIENNNGIDFEVLEVISLDEGE